VTFTALREEPLPAAAESPSWNLSDLFCGPDDPRIDETLVQATEDAAALAARSRGRIAALAADDPAALADILRGYEAIQQTLAKPSSYASLRFAAETTAENGAFLQRVRERVTAATVLTLFLNDELTNLGAETLAALAEHPMLSGYAHYLGVVRARTPYRLSEPEERVLEETANTGRRAFVRLFEELNASLRFRMPGEDRDRTLPETVSLQQSPDRTQRRVSADVLSAGLASQARTIAYLFNTLLQDKATTDRLRRHAYPEEERHIANELAPEISETVVGVAEKGFPLVARYYRAKADLLGIEQLTHYDRYAPVGGDASSQPFGEAQKTVLAGFAELSPEYAATAQRFFDGGWIDAMPRPSKRGGAFCSFVTPDLHPYVFLTYLGKSSDVRTLAHELGHGIHSYLARDQTYLNYHGTLPMAEVASTFAEMLVFDYQQRRESDPRRLLTLYATQIDQAIATLFRQATMYRFEQAIHRERRRGEISVQRFGEIWQESVGAMFGDSLKLDAGHELWWSYVPHFVATPFYVYAYTFGVMLAYALFARMMADGAQRFAPGYLELLRLGGSCSPRDLVRPLGVDLDDPAFWQGAVEAFEAQVVRFEALIPSAGRLEPGH
jgi:oligoendopeptidase F